MLEADRRPTDADGPRPRKKAKTAQHRDLASPLLYVHRDTLACALGRCVPCLYKVWPGGRRGLPPNVRPELCPRARRGGRAPRRRARRGRPVPARRARADRRRRDFTSASRSRGSSRARRAAAAADAADAGAERAPARAPMVFTSHEPRERAAHVPERAGALRALDALAAAGAARVVHGVDATALDAAALGGGAPFDVVCWNFPCVSLPAGRDGRATELAETGRCSAISSRASRAAARAAAAAARRARPRAVHVTHKTIEPFSWWDVPALAAEAGFALARRVVFDKCLYAGYTNRKALDRKGFACNDAETLVFELRDARAG